MIGTDVQTNVLNDGITHFRATQLQNKTEKRVLIGIFQDETCPLKRVDGAEGIEGVRAVSRGYKGKGGKKKKRKRRKAEICDDIFSILIKMLCNRMIFRICVFTK